MFKLRSLNTMDYSILPIKREQDSYCLYSTKHFKYITQHYRYVEVCRYIYFRGRVRRGVFHASIIEIWKQIMTQIWLKVACNTPLSSGAISRYQIRICYAVPDPNFYAFPDLNCYTVPDPNLHTDSDQNLKKSSFFQIWNRIRVCIGNGTRYVKICSCLVWINIRI